MFRRQESFPRNKHLRWGSFCYQSKIVLSQVMSVMSCSMVAEEPLNGGEDFEGIQEETEGDVGKAPTEEVVTFGEEEGESEEVTGFMLKAPGEVEQRAPAGTSSGLAARLGAQWFTHRPAGS